jgi:four helix bundle protein
MERQEKQGQQGQGGREGVGRAFDLEARLLKYATLILRLADELPGNRSANLLAGQLVRSGISPLPNYTEAQYAPSRDDFIQRLEAVAKELRQSHGLLQLVKGVSLVPEPKVAPVLNETELLIRIFKKSIQTARANRRGSNAAQGAELDPAE